MTASTPKIAHIVYFSLHDNSLEARRRFVAACDEYLSNHEGVLYYGAGLRGESFDRPVNDKAFDVGLHLVFADREAHDRYQQHPRHKQFIEATKANWKEVRVFDAEVA